MIVKLKKKHREFIDISPGELYFVIGIEADAFRILNDFGNPYLYPPDCFEIVNSQEPDDWVTSYGDDGERYSYPPKLNQPGFFEDYFDGIDMTRYQLWHVINKKLAETK
jgi:hypothetical protein